MRAWATTRDRSCSTGYANRSTRSSGIPDDAATCSADSPARTRVWISRGRSGLSDLDLDLAEPGQVTAAGRPDPLVERQPVGLPGRALQQQAVAVFGEPDESQLSHFLASGPSGFVVAPG